MSEPKPDELGQMLAEGWDVSGYSVCVLTNGTLVHNILLRKENSLTSIAVGTSRGEEQGRTKAILTPVNSMPPAPAKKGFFG